MMRDPYAALGTLIAIVAGLLVVGTLCLVAQHAAWSHQAAHTALAGWR